MENKITEHVLYIAIEPKTKADFFNMFKALRDIYDMFPYFGEQSDYKNKHFFITAAEEGTLYTIIERLKEESDIEFRSGNVQIICKKTIKNTVKAEGKFIRQCGGSCSYGHCIIEIEPNERGKGYEFENNIYDDNIIPKEYIESVKEGVELSMPLAGFEYLLTDIKVKLVGGSYHPYDSSEMTFKIAASMANRNAMRNSEYILLEPIINLIVKKENYTEEILHIVENNRGKVEEDYQEKLEITIPLREIIGECSIALKRLVTQALSMKISHYKEVPEQILKSMANEISFEGNKPVGSILEYTTEEEKILKDIKEYQTKLEAHTCNYEYDKERMGFLYYKLAKIRNTEKNLLKAINLCNEGLSACKKSDKSTLLSIHRCIGKSFLMLSTIKDSEINLKNAINALTQAVKFENYSKLDNSAYLELADAYLALSMIKDNNDNKNNKNNKINLLKAKELLEQLLKKCMPKKDSYSFKYDIVKYFAVKNRIGNIYLRLADVEDSKTNIIKALNIFEENANGEELDKDYLIYSDTQNYIGLAYMKLSNLSSNKFWRNIFSKDCSTEENILKAIEAFNLALSIKFIKSYESSNEDIHYSFGEYHYYPFEEDYPLKYAEIQKNLGQAYIELAKINNREKNLTKAKKSFDKVLQCYNEALKTKSQKCYPTDYEKIQEYIKNLSILISES